MASMRKTSAGNKLVEIIDIRQNTVGISIINELRRGLRTPVGAEKRLPTLLLYDEAGLKLFEEITYVDEFYPTSQEIAILQQVADEIAARVAHDSIIVELGSGNLRKVNILLEALERAEKNVNYYALDLDRSELERTLRDIPPDYQHVTARGLHGTYDDGAVWLTDSSRVHVPKCLLSLGSSIGNFDRTSGAEFVKQFADILGTGDGMLIAMDGCKDADRVFHAHNDSDGVTHRFILNGLLNANHLLKTEAFDVRKWTVIGEYDCSNGRHQVFVSPTEDVLVDGISIKRGERVRIEESYKYSPHDVVAIFEHARLAEGARWTNAQGDYALHMASKPRFWFSPKAVAYAARPVPGLQDFEELWKVWDLVTEQMIPRDELLSKPIKLRNECISYLGHIPAFLDTHMTKATNGEATDRASFSQMFERGIDPDVDNPEICHAHGKLPETWPPITEISEYQNRIRSRVRTLYQSGAVEDNRKVGRGLWIGFEHEVMYLETLLYMLLQSGRMLPPDGVIRPDFVAMAREADVREVPNEWIDVPARDLTVGLQDAENDDGPDHYYGWDNEKPKYSSHTVAFQAKARPITNSDYAVYLEKSHLGQLPASWKSSEDTNGHTDDHTTSNSNDPSNGLSNGDTNGELNGHTNGCANGASTGTDNHGKTAPPNERPSEAFLKGKAIKTVFGNVPLEQALHWPVFASYDELGGCAKWMGGRIPSADEVRTIYSYACELKSEAKQKLAADIPAVNSHTVNDSVDETPPQGSGVNNSTGTTSFPNPHDIFVDLHGANVGFRHWHPTPVTQHGNKLCGRGDMGGVWEWTSSVLEKHEGFEPMRLYPAYTAGFFDTKHNVVLGGSWATHPRVAGRKTFVNWYRRNYPFVWAGARIVRDIQGE